MIKCRCKDPETTAFTVDRVYNHAGFMGGRIIQCVNCNHRVLEIAGQEKPMWAKRAARLRPTKFNVVETMTGGERLDEGNEEEETQQKESGTA